MAGAWTSSVNNVGGGQRGKIWEMSVADWDAVMRLNLRGTFSAMPRRGADHDEAALGPHRVPVLGRAREGTPWTAYSTGAPRIPRPRRARTASSATFPSSRRVRRHRERGRAGAHRQRARRKLRKLDETMEYGPTHLTLLKRLGLPVEVANAVLFLASRRQATSPASRSVSRADADREKRHDEATFAVLLTVLAVLVAAGSAIADDYPSRPIRMVAPAPAGGASDIYARLVAEKISPMLDALVIVDNRVGAAGRIGYDHVAKSPADGYTLVLASAAILLQHAMYASLPYDPVKDFRTDLADRAHAAADGRAGVAAGHRPAPSSRW